MRSVYDDVKNLPPTIDERRIIVVASILVVRLCCLSWIECVVIVFLMSYVLGDVRLLPLYLLRGRGQDHDGGGLFIVHYFWDEFNF